jgi:hypothetical protein
MEEMTTPICVIFVGSSPPSSDWLQKKAKPLVVRREKVRAALVWLKDHNPLYKDITINHSMLDGFDDHQILPVHVEHVLPSITDDILTSRYDPSLPLESTTSCPSETPNSIPFQNVVITDVDGQAPVNELRAAALRHIKKKGGGYIEIPHDREPVNEFFNPSLFPMIYPCLFPYGIGGFENAGRSSKLSLKRQIKHLFSMADRRFQEHYSFLFTAFNILQRRAVLLHSSLKVQKSKFDSIAAEFATVSPEAVHIVSERIGRGDFSTAHTDEERKVLSLMKQVKVVTSHVPGSSAARIVMRNEMRALMMDRGLPSFYVTINPADVFNPLVKFLAGSEIDIDNMLPEEVPNYWEQSFLVAQNPAIAAKFFNVYMKAFISAVLGYDPKHKNLEGGILGVVKAYYGCVEAQGRGTLHCHMMIWIEGSLNPNEIKQRILDAGDTDFRDRLLAFLDDTISNSIPQDPDPDLIVPSSKYHPCSVRGVGQGLNGQELDTARQKDMHNLVKQCQSHTHTGTCYKYWKGPPDPRECRFDLDESNTCSQSTVDPETGELCLRCLDGLVNNFNATILEAVRCNMDIKFIGSGESAKAILYYISDYITKSQLKTHVAFAALELAVTKLGEYDPQADELMVRSKRLLQKCAYAMISHQELSAQQVCSYLMDFEDHFTSHEYQNLYWTSFEKLINDEDPSPDCYKTVPVGKDKQGQSENCSVNIIDPSNIEFEDGLDDNANPSQMTDEMDENDDEIGVAVDQIGNLVAKAGQVADYQLRDVCLNDICVWDFVAQVEKIKKGQRREPACQDDGDSNHEGDVGEDNAIIIDSMEDTSRSPTSSHSVDELLAIRSRIRPRVQFLPEHLESDSHVLRIRAPDSRRVPVPIGPGIPRRDKLEVRERYCRLMLILFKPWRHASDLRRNNQTWHDAFDEFAHICPVKLKVVIDNMQILHECKDSRDDHFIGRRSRARYRSTRIPHDIVGDREVEDDFGGEEEESLLLDHFEAMENARSQRISKGRDTALKCLQHAESGGLFQMIRPQTNTDLEDTSVEIIKDSNSDSLEDVWRKTYENRRDQWKKKSSCQGISPMSLSEGSVLGESRPSDSLLRDGSAFREALSEADIRLPAIQQQINAWDPDHHVDISGMINEYDMNIEQARAFRIVAEHSLERRSEPLRMYLGGAGGTGKSRVINALKDFFERRSQGRRFRLASYTGVAAKNISGMTLHAALSLNQRSKGGSQGKTLRDLVAMWEGVEYLFIDEVSMIGCNFLLQISEALTAAKGNTSAFGGINIIFAGDFSQLPPVAQTRLFGYIKTAEVSTKHGQNAVLGKLLWLSVKTVVILTEIKRQSGTKNTEFVSLLGRLREGKCNDKDYSLLRSRVICNANPDWSDPEWAGVPVIVSDNTAKDALNEKAAVAFAQQTGQELHWYYATDKRGGKPLTDTDLNNKLETLHSGLTNQRLGRIPLVLGMPVMISTNFDVDAGVVNGCTGTLKKIRYRVDSDGKRHAISCIVHAPNTSGENMPGLPEQYVVALEDSIDMTFTHPHSKRKCKIKRTQVPLIPAFAMTAHKAQGQTLTKVVVDLESCSGTESPYVMISRVRSLDGLLILRPFSKQKITSRQSEDTRREMRRLELLRLETIMKLGTAEESAIAQATIAETRFRHQIGINNDVTHKEQERGDPMQQLRHLQNEIFYLTNTESGSLSGSKVTKDLRQQNKTTKTIPYASTSMEFHTPDTPMDIDHPVSRTKLDNSSTEHVPIYITADSTISDTPMHIDLQVSTTVLGKRASMHMDTQSDKSQTQRRRLD